MELDRETMRARDRLRGQQDRLRRPAQGRALRDAPAVAHRRVLHRLPPRHRQGAAEAGRHDPRRADRDDGPARPHQRHHAPPLPRALQHPALRARRRPRRPRPGPQRDDPPRRPRPAPGRPAPRDPRRAARSPSATSTTTPRRSRPPSPPSARTSPASSRRRATPRRPPRSRTRASAASGARSRPSCASCARRSRSSTPPPPSRSRRFTNLRRASPFLKELFETLGPFAEASQPAIKTLGDAAKQGRGAIEAAREPRGRAAARRRRPARGRRRTSR